MENTGSIPVPENKLKTNKTKQIQTNKKPQIPNHFPNLA